jgi:uncharacterized protein YgiM (DUF1202 family)
MPEMRWIFLPVFLLSSGLFCDQACAEAAHQNATIHGASHASLRAGPSVVEPRRGVLTEGDKITVEGQQGDWYLVQTTDGLKGYVHKSLVKLVAEEKTPAVSAELNPAKPAVESQQPSKPPASDSSAAAPQLPPRPPPTTVAPANPTETVPAPVPTKEPEASTRKTKKLPSLIELLEGREADMILWGAIAVAFFLMGWICGGNFYLRRDRLRRTRLRF